MKNHPKLSRVSKNSEVILSFSSYCLTLSGLIYFNKSKTSEIPIYGLVAAVLDNIFLAIKN